MASIAAYAGPGDGPALQSWPLLAWLPDKGVVTEDRHLPVEYVRDVYQDDCTLDGTAAQLGTSPRHVEQALSYLRSAS